MTDPRTHRRDDTGATLVELLVYIILLGIILGLIATTFISGKSVQAGQATLADASNEVHIAVGPIEHGLRNAATVQVDTATMDGRLLVVKTRVGEDNDDPSSWVCQGWYYDEPSATIYTRRDQPGPTAATAGIVGSPDLSSWSVAIADVTPVDGKPVFKTTGVGGGASMLFDVRTSRDASKVRVDTSALPRKAGIDIGEESCGEYL